MPDIVHLFNLFLAPFFNFTLLYFAFVRDPVGDVWTTILKCAPIVSLMLYILLRDYSNDKKLFAQKRSTYTLLGLIFSCTGDVLLNIDLFPFGMAAFGVAHVFYIAAFGWKPLKWIIAIPLYAIGIIMYAVFFKHLDQVLVIGLPIYAALLLTMCWRALALAVYKRDFLNIFCGIGSILFVVSDGLIAVNMFLSDLPNARIYIMLTYYTAQLSIALNSSTKSAPRSKRS